MRLDLSIIRLVLVDLADWHRDPTRLGAVPGNDFERSLMMTILATGSFHHQQSSNAMPSAVGDFFFVASSIRRESRPPQKEITTNLQGQESIPRPLVHWLRRRLASDRSSESV